jgi:hypothetical protein
MRKPPNGHPSAVSSACTQSSRKSPDPWLAGSQLQLLAAGRAEDSNTIADTTTRSPRSPSHALSCTIVPRGAICSRSRSRASLLRHTRHHKAGRKHRHLHAVRKILEVEIIAGECRGSRGIRGGVIARGRSIVVVGESWTVARTT